MREFEFIRQLLPEVAALLANNYRDRAALSFGKQKGIADLVTEADLAAQHHIETAILAAFPGDVLVGEEAGKDHPPPNPDARCWVCDPIDGTHNFARGMVPSWGISLAYLEGGEPRAAGIALPELDELFLAREGSVSLRNGQPTRVSTSSDLAEARVEVDFGRPLDRENCMSVGQFALQHGGQIRCHGAAVVGFCTIACGAAEAYVHGGLQPWDFAAALLIIRQAGGRMTRLDGSEARVFDGKRGMVASNGAIHPQIMDGLRSTVTGR
jgi:myo-inositol-1(or 4)-monophosphatase